MWHYHHHIVHVTLSSSHRPRDIIIITSSTWHYHHSTARYFKFKYRCQNIFLQPWKLLRILQNNDAISHYKKYGRNDYGRTGLWTNRLESLLYAACTKRRFTSITIHVNCQYKFVLSYIFIHWLWGASWSWSYGSWIYNCLCNQCLSPITLWFRILIRVRCTTLCDKVCQ
jgi:hypothetical protein